MSGDLSGLCDFKRNFYREKFLSGENFVARKKLERVLERNLSREKILREKKVSRDNVERKKKPRETYSRDKSPEIIII